MIDVRTQELVKLSQLVKRLPAHREQRPVHPSTAHRWRNPGLHGVRLECIKIGGIWYTSMEAFQRFCEQLSTLGVGSTPVPSKTAENTRYESVERELNDLGLQLPGPCDDGPQPDHQPRYQKG